MSVKFLALLLSLLLTGYQQNDKSRLPVFKHTVNNVQPDPAKKWTIVVVAHTHCGFSWKSMRMFKDRQLYRKANIIYYEYGGEENIMKYLKDTPYFDLYLFVDAEKEKNKNYNQKFFPVIYIYKEGKLKKRIKGISERIMRKILKIVNE